MLLSEAVPSNLIHTLMAGGDIGGFARQERIHPDLDRMGIKRGKSDQRRNRLFIADQNGAFGPGQN
jgi:hypothetical protein